MSSVLQQKTIAVTRPTGQAEKLSVMLQNAGATVLSFPLIAIAPLPKPDEVAEQFETLAQQNWLIFISSNAVQHGMTAIQKIWKTSCLENLKFAAIGPVTAQALAEYGIAEVLIPESRFDSEALLAMPAMQNMQQQNVMIVRGIGGRELLAKTLTQRGANVQFAECYQRVNPQNNADCLYDSDTQTSQCDAIVVTSSEAMRHLLDLAEINTINAAEHWLQKVKLCVNLPRVAELANSLGLTTYIAGKPGDEAMLNCVTDALSR